MSKYKGKDQKLKFTQKLKKYLAEYNEKSGIHGLRYLTEKRSACEKTVWAMALAICLLFCFVMIYEIMLKYENSPVVVSLSRKFTPIYETPFPSVTVCPETKCDKKIFNYTDAYFKFQNNISIPHEEFRNFIYMAHLCHEENEEILQRGEETVSENFFQAIENMKPSPLISCTFLGKAYKNCENFLIPIITDVGICYTFNVLDRTEIFRKHVVQYKNYHSVGEYDHSLFQDDFTYSENAGVSPYPRRALYSGARNSLDIVLLHKVEDVDYVCDRYYEGFRIWIHNPVDLPRLSQQYFRVPVGRTVLATVHPELVVTSENLKYVSPEKRQCYWLNERYLSHFKLYTQSNCLLECRTNYTLKYCGCVDFYMPRDNSTPMCGTKKTKCLADAYDHFHLEDLNAKLSGMEKKIGSFCDCKPLCTELSFDVETSHSQIVLSEFVSPDIKFIKGVTLVSIYVKDEQFMSVERNQLYGIFDLISNFGGLLGLFTGFSLISLFEIIYYLTLRIFYNRKLYGNWSGPNNM